MEVLFGLLILTIIVTSSLAVFFERERRLQFAEETILVWQALANEAEARRHVAFRNLNVGQEEVFASDTVILDRLNGAEGRVRVEEVGPGVRRVRMRVTWLDGTRSIETEIMRTDTGGGTLR